MPELTLKHALGQLLIVGFEGTQLPIPLIGAIHKGEVGGVILFSRNIESREALLQMTAELKALPAPYPLWIAVDQEGGKVQRIGPRLGTEALPSARDIAKLGLDKALALAKQSAQELLSLGFNLNFAPVLDIDNNPHNPIIGDRAYGESPEKVIEFALPIAQAFIDAGLCPCGKHFPGHGAAQEDSHLEKTCLHFDKQRFRDIEWKPFQAAIQAQIPMLMTAHLNLTQIDPIYPATLSREIIGQILRKELGYDGLILSDDLEMAAISDHYGIQKAVLLGLRAGVDAFLICKTEALWSKLAKNIQALAKDDPPLRERIFEAAQRMLTLKERFLRPTQAS